MKYVYNPAEPIDGIESLEFPRLTWAHYKKLKLTTGLKEFIPTFIKFATPVLTDEQIGNLTGNDYDELNDMFAHMITRDEEYNGRQFKLTTPVVMSGDSGDITITALSFTPAKLSDLYDYFQEPDEQAQVEMFVTRFSHSIGDSKAAKAITLTQGMMDILDAKDMRFIADNIAGKSQGGSASWSVVAA